MEVFDKFYVCFAALRDSWLAYCRPIIGIDGCFLKTATKGHLLAAVGRDANNQIYPMAWAVVQSEDKDSWLWFIKKLKADFRLGVGQGFTIISDRQKGLLIAVQQEIPAVEHRMCARHIYSNMKRVLPKKKRMKQLFWAVVESYNEADYNVALQRMKDYDMEVYEAMMSRNPYNCTRAFFGINASCEDALNNFSESYNRTIDKARAMPLVEMLETIRRQAMDRINIRMMKSSGCQGKFTPRVKKIMESEDKERKWCNSYPGPPGTYEVTERETYYAVNMRARTCSCRRWDLSGIPCRRELFLTTRLCTTLMTWSSIGISRKCGKTPTRIQLGP